MKTLLTTCLLLFLSALLPAALQAQYTLYGLTKNGGETLSGGVLYRYSPHNKQFVPLFKFQNQYGQNPQAPLLLAADGKFYGCTYTGGSANCGTLFSFDPRQERYEVGYAFRREDGRNLTAPLCAMPDGLLYGLASAGGSQDRGTLFSFDPKGGDFRKLVEFTATTGGSPLGGLLQASDGKLYGCTYADGTGGSGSLFRFDPRTLGYEPLYQFGRVDGQQRNAEGGSPTCTLVEGKGGWLYGTCKLGGSEGIGTLFAFHPDSLKMRKCWDFRLAQQGQPGRYDQLAVVGDSCLYGITAKVVYRYHLQRQAFETVFELQQLGGGWPSGGLRLWEDGWIYGTLAEEAGSNKKGLLFRFRPGQGPERLYDFLPSAGGHLPYGPPTGMCVPFSQQQQIGACQGDSLRMPDGKLLRDLQQSFSYVSELKGIAGCDSTILSEVTVSPHWQRQLDVQICHGSRYVLPDGQVIASVIQDQQFNTLLRSQAGCDSLVNTHLHVLPSYRMEANDSLCAGQGYTFPDGWKVDNLQTNEDHLSFLKTREGCDSIIDTQLRVLSVDLRVIPEKNGLKALAEKASFQWYDLGQNRPLLGATQAFFSPTYNSTYAVEVTQRGCTARSAAFPFQITGLEDAQEAQISIGPNPTTGLLHITFPFPEKGGWIAVRNMMGQLLEIHALQQTSPCQLQLDYPSGIYLLELRPAKGRAQYFRILKQ